MTEHDVDMLHPPSPPPSSSSPPTQLTEDATTTEDTLSVTITHSSTPYTFHLPQSSTLNDLTDLIHETLSIPSHYQKLLAPKLGLLKDPNMPLASLPQGKKITLMGSSSAKVEQVQEAARGVKSNIRRLGGSSRSGGSNLKAQRPAARSIVDPTRAREDALYTFLELRPLQYLPHPETSLAYLQRIRDDPGIRFIMRKYKWTVPLLLEMNPADHTTQESKTLGLNRNKGEVIELRLRTDDYGGYRDYKTVRRTAVHELAHNIFSEHDRDFWDLYAKLEKEVARADWTSGGRAVGGEGAEFYEPPGGARYLGDIEEGEIDEGGWEGGEWVLGGKGTRQGEGLSRREVLARAAEERMRRQREIKTASSANSGDGVGGEGPSTSSS